MRNNNNSGDGNSLFDSKLVLSIILVGIFWIGWQGYLAKKYPDMYVNKQGLQTQRKSQQSEGEKKVEDLSLSESPSARAMSENKQNHDSAHNIYFHPEKTLPYKGRDLDFSISSEGMGISRVFIKGYKDRQHQPIILDQGLFQLSTFGVDQPLHFEIQSPRNGLFEGVSQNGSLIIKISTEVKEEESGVTFLKNKLFIEDPEKNFKGFQISIFSPLINGPSPSFFSPSVDTQEFTVLSAGNMERVPLTGKIDQSTSDGTKEKGSPATSEKTENILEKLIPTASLMSVGSQYFTAAIVDKSVLIPDAFLRVEWSKKMASSFLKYIPRVGLSKSYEFEYFSYVGPKSFSNLKGVDPQLTEIINFGMFSSIAKILLYLLKAFYQVVQNWGVAIILLTILVRIVVLPFNIMSYKSMKKMQQIQPLIQSIREKYKDDVQTQNREVMAIMRENKANPVGGCLPMILQMPIFLALYQVFGQSVELYQAPFFGWIKDLSLKDPFFILPILMGASMWIQGKITPSTQDPAQAKVMQFMPVLFSLMMISLPSGLTLYIFISTIFGVIQQWFFLKKGSENKGIIVSDGSEIINKKLGNKNFIDVKAVRKK